MELKAWLENSENQIAERWFSEIKGHGGVHEVGAEEILQFFLGTLVAVIPFCFGNGRASGEEIWHQANDLYGSLALRRGLSAGEVVEELQLLQRVILRFILEDLPPDGVGRRLQKEIMALNQTLDEGVVRANVAYVDDLFFAHLQGSGVPEGVTPEVEEEMRSRMMTFRKELLG